MKKVLYLLLLSLVFSCTSYTESTDTITQPVWNGEAGTHDKFPSILFLTKNKITEHCSGTLIKPDLILTAAHCVVFFPESMKAVYGYETMPDYDCDDCFLDVTVKKTHPGFNNVPDTWNDIALILLKKPVKNAVLGRFIPTEHYTLLAEGAEVVIAGYGRDENGSVGILNFGSVPITEIYSPTEMVLGVDNPDAINACYGDSGGPAYFYVDNEEFVVGVTSRVPDGKPVECGHGAIYTRPEAYESWIESAYLEMLDEAAALPEEPEIPGVITKTTGDGCNISGSSNTLWPIFLMLFLVRYGRKND